MDGCGWLSKMYLVAFIADDIIDEDGWIIAGWLYGYLIAFIAYDIVDEESGKIFSIHNINHLQIKMVSGL